MFVLASYGMTKVFTPEAPTGGAFSAVDVRPVRGLIKEGLGVEGLGFRIVEVLRNVRFKKPLKMLISPC